MHLIRADGSIEYPGVARVTASFRSHGPSSFGTGILVSPNHVLTCAHTVSQFNPLSPSPDDLERVFQDCRIFFPRTAEFDEETVGGAVTSISGHDLALIKLAKVVNRPPLRFEPFLQTWMFAPAYGRRFVAGFHGSDSLSCSTTEFHNEVVFHWRADTGTLQEFQTAGGIPPGMSGSPMISVRHGVSTCFGMVFLGGLSAGRSRFVASNTILEFLKRSQVDAEFRGPFGRSRSRFGSIGDLLRHRRTWKGYRAAEVAQQLGIRESLLDDWELNRSLPGAQLQTGIAELLMHGDPDSVSEWLRLLGMPDFLVRMQELESPEAMCEIVAAGQLRGVASGKGPADSSRAQFDIGAEARVIVRVPQLAELIFIDVEAICECNRKYTLVGASVLPRHTVAAGCYMIPGGPETFEMGGPAGTNCLIAIAVAFESAGPLAVLARELVARPLRNEELDAVVRQIEAMDSDRRWVSLSEYDVCSP